jgi:hypothetical protein
VPEHQKQQATVAGLVAAASRGPDQLSNFKASQVVASGVAPPRVFPFGRFSSWGIFIILSRVSKAKSVQTLINRMVKKSTLDFWVFRRGMITGYLAHGGRIEVRQRMAAHSNAKTRGLYDRRNDDI